MQKRGSSMVYSASDLTAFLEKRAGLAVSRAERRPERVLLGHSQRKLAAHFSG